MLTFLAALSIRGRATGTGSNVVRKKYGVGKKLAAAIVNTSGG
jgi:hypothetical protein